MTVEVLLTDAGSCLWSFSYFVVKADVRTATLKVVVYREFSTAGSRERLAQSWGEERFVGRKQNEQSLAFTHPND